MEWVEELPPSRQRGGHSKYEEEAAELRANPGRWAKLSSWPTTAQANNNASAIRHGKIKAFAADPAEWEVAVRMMDIYVRYVG